MKPENCRMKAAHRMTCVESMCQNCPYKEEWERAERLVRTIEKMLELRQQALRDGGRDA